VVFVVREAFIAMFADLFLCLIDEAIEMHAFSITLGLFVNFVRYY
jgi:hypothetical protein